MDLKTTPLRKAFWHYTLPSIAALLVSGTYQIIDGIFVGHFIGPSGLAGINLAWPWIGILLAVGMMIGIGTGAQVSIAAGADNQTLAKSFLVNGLALLCIVGLPLALILHHNSEWFLYIQGATEDAAAQGNAYLGIIAPSAPIILASIALPFLVRNLGAPRIATIAMLTGAISNILLDALFIVWLGWGLEGAALATVLGESLSILICLFFLIGSRNPLKLYFKDIKVSIGLISRIVSTGVSSMLMYLYISFSVILHNVLLLKYGSAIEVAAYSISGYLMAFYYLTAEGISGGMQPLVSYYYGARQFERVKDTFKLAAKYGVGIGVFFVAMILWVPDFFVGFFSRGNLELEAVARWAIRLQLCGLFLDGFLVLAASWFQSLGLARKATLITLFNMMIQIPFLLTLPWLLGLNGVWIAVPISNLCLSVFVAALLWREFKRF